jgi:phosphoribosylformimino-5-aminoimidazole carboxamide ribonucleotide (ProFAR) isomerase
VPFTVIPAIDVWHGRVALATASGPIEHDAFDGDPLHAAAAYVSAGATWIHLVDLNLAFSGVPENADVVRTIAERHPGARLQVSGGIVSARELGRYAEAGASRLVIGSAALGDRLNVATLVREANIDVLIGLEVADGVLRARSGSVSGADLPLDETLARLVELPVAGFLVTAVSRVAALTGPDTDLVARVSATGVPTMGAGGIRSIADLAALRAAGAVGAVVGRAALDGDLDVGEAVRWAAA